MLPDRIALPTLIQFILGPGVSLPQDILLDAFIDYISATERQTLKTALDGNYSSAFPNHLLTAVTNILSRFGCRQVPKPSTLMNIIEQVAKYEFCTKPAAAVALVNTGIPLKHKAFWATKSSRVIQSLCHSLAATPSKVIAKLDMTEAHNSMEERVCGYLTTMIRTCNPQS